MAKIEKIVAREILDSRGQPTVEADVYVAGGYIGSAKVPSGASTGQYEAKELRDGDEKRFRGKGVQKAVGHIRAEIQAALLGKDTANQSKIDRTMLELDGTPDKSRLGANAILAVSMACAKAEAASQGLPLYLYLQQIFPKRQPVMPVPQMNLINGGVHASNKLSIQEFHIVPVGSMSYGEALRSGAEVYAALKELLKKDDLPVEVGDEGGFAPRLTDSEAAFAYLTRAIELAGYVPGVDLFLGIDAAASEFYDEELKVYLLDGKSLSSMDLMFLYKTWRERYPLISIEDPFDQNDWKAWKGFMEKSGHAMQVVGDDLFVTNSSRIRQGIVEGAANAVLIKLNQVGSLTETMQAILLAQDSNMRAVISHRSGETEDTFISDLAVATGAGQIKTGALARSERMAKYNRLLKIEEDLQAKLATPFGNLLQYHQPG